MSRKPKNRVKTKATPNMSDTSRKSLVVGSASEVIIMNCSED